MTIILDGTNGINTPGLTDTAAASVATTLTVTGAATAASLQVGGVTTNVYPLVSGTSVASTSGTSIDFINIPSWVRRITVMVSGLGSSSSGIPLLQLGTVSSLEVTGYSGSGISNSTLFALSSGFPVRDTWSSTSRTNGAYTLTLLDAASNTWACAAIFGTSNTTGLVSVGGTKPLASTLTRLRLYIDGTQTFTAGLVNILWE